MRHRHIGRVLRLPRSKGPLETTLDLSTPPDTDRVFYHAKQYYVNPPYSLSFMNYFSVPFGPFYLLHTALHCLKEHMMAEHV